MPAAYVDTDPSLGTPNSEYSESGLLEPEQWSDLAELQVDLTSLEITIRGRVDIVAIEATLADPDYRGLLDQSPPDPDLMMLSYVASLVEPGSRLGDMVSSPFGGDVLGLGFAQDVLDNPDGKMGIRVTLPTPTASQERIQARIGTDALPSGVDFVGVDEPHITDTQTTELVAAREHGFALRGWQAIHDAIDHSLGAAALDLDFHDYRAIPFANHAIDLRTTNPEEASLMDKLLTEFIESITTKITLAAVQGSRKPNMENFYVKLVEEYGRVMVDLLTGGQDQLDRTVDVSWRNAKEIARPNRTLRKLFLLFVG